MQNNNNNHAEPLDRKPEDQAPEPVSSRRAVLGPRGLAAAAAAVALAGRASAKAQGPVTPGTSFINLFIRGGLDANHILGQYTDVSGWYSALRNTTRMFPPGPNDNDALHLTNTPQTFGISKKSAGLLEPWNDGQLALILQMGSKINSFSHFTKQDGMERANVSESACTFTAYDGWLARFLNNYPSACPEPPHAVAVASSAPIALQGADGVIATPDLTTFDLLGPPNDPRRSAYVNAVDGSYASFGPPLSEAADTLRKSVAFVKTAVTGYQERAGSNYPNSPFGQSLKNIAALIRAGDPLRCPRVYHVDHGGHDQHDDADLFASSDGAYGNVLQDLCDGLRALWWDLNDPMDTKKFVLFGMSEFGRRAAENGSQGTDHGEGGVGFLLGQSVRGGQIHGDWRTLDPAQLTPGGNLAVTVDYRQIVCEILDKEFGVTDPSLIFPGCFAEGHLDVLL